MLVKLDHLHNFRGENSKNIWVATTQYVCSWTHLLSVQWLMGSTRSSHHHKGVWLWVPRRSKPSASLQGGLRNPNGFRRIPLFSWPFFFFVDQGIGSYKWVIHVTYTYCISICIYFMYVLCIFIIFYMSPVGEAYEAYFLYDMSQDMQKALQIKWWLLWDSCKWA